MRRVVSPFHTKQFRRSSEIFQHLGVTNPSSTLLQPFTHHASIFHPFQPFTCHASQPFRCYNQRSNSNAERVKLPPPLPTPKRRVTEVSRVKRPLPLFSSHGYATALREAVGLIPRMLPRSDDAQCPEGLKWGRTASYFRGDGGRDLAKLVTSNPPPAHKGEILFSATLAGDPA